MNGPEDLPLRDIHLPEALSWWPPAAGWWLLAGLLVLAAAAAWLVHRRREYLKLSAIRLARVELQHLDEQYRREHDPVTLSRQLSILLRRLCISLYPRAEVAGLTGEAWLAFLDIRSKDRPFSRGEGRLLAEAPYRGRVSEGEADRLLRHCRDWIETAITRGGDRR